MNWQDRMDFLMGFYTEMKQPEALVEARKRSDKTKLHRTMAASGDVDRRKAGIDLLGREEINKPAGERDNEAIKDWADELLVLDKESDTANYFLGAAAYRDGRRTEEGAEERQKGYSRLEAIERLKKYQEKNKEDEEALLFLADIYWEKHKDIYRYTPDYIAFDPDAARSFEGVYDYFMKKHEKEKKEKNEEEADKALVDALKYIDMTIVCDPRNGSLKNKRAVVLKKLGRKDASVAEAEAVIKASREKVLFGLIVTKEDRSAAEHILADIQIADGRFDEAFNLLKRHVIRSFRPWRGGPVYANTMALLSLVYAGRAGWRDKKKAAKYRQNMLKTGEDAGTVVEADVLEGLAMQAENENTYDGLLEAIQLRQTRKTAPGVDEKEEDIKIAELHIKLSDLNVKKPRAWHERLRFWTASARAMKDLEERMGYLTKAKELSPDTRSDLLENINMVMLDLHASWSGLLTRLQRWNRNRVLRFLYRVNYFGRRLPEDHSDKIMEHQLDNAELCLDLDEKAEKDEAGEYVGERDWMEETEEWLRAAEDSKRTDKKELPEKYKKVRSVLNTRRGDAAFKQENYSGALAYYDDGVREDDNNARAHLGKARALRKMGDVERAAEELDKAFGIDPSIDGLEMEDTRDLIKLYGQLGRFNEAGSAAEKLKARHLREEKRRQEVNIKNDRDWAAELEDIVRAAVEAEKLREAVKRKEEAIAELPGRDKYKPYYVYADNDLELDKNELNRRDTELRGRMDDFDDLAKDMMAFNAVIGNSRGRPADEAYEHLNAFYNLLQERNFLADINNSYPIDLALAESYQQKGDHEKAAEHARHILTSIPSLPGPRQTRTIISARAVLADHLIKSDEPERLRVAMEELSAAANGIAGMYESYRDTAGADAVLSGVKDLVEAAGRDDIKIADTDYLREGVFDVLGYLLPVAGDTAAAQLGISLALEVPDSSAGVFIGNVLRTSVTGDDIRLIFLQSITGKISDDPSIAGKFDDVLGDLADELVNSDNDRVKAQALLLRGLDASHRLKEAGTARKSLFAALKLAPDLKGFVFKAVAGTYSWNFIQKLRYSRRAKKAMGPAAGDYLRAADKEFEKGKFRKARADYERALELDPALKNDNTVMSNLAQSYAEDRGTLRQRFAMFFRRERTRISSAIDNLRKALQASPEGDLRDGLTGELIGKLERLKVILRGKHEKMRLKKRALNWPAFRESIVALNLEIGDLYLRIDDGRTAETIFTETLKYAPADQRAQAGLDKAKGIKPEEEKDADELLSEAEKDVNEGNFEKASSLLDKAVAKDSGLEDRVKSLREKMDEIDFIVNDLMDHYVGQSFIADYTKWYDENDPEGVRRWELLKKARGELVGRSATELGAGMGMFEEWFGYKDGDKTDVARKKIEETIIADNLTEIGKEHPEGFDLSVKDTFYKRAFVRTGELAESGKFDETSALAEKLEDGDGDQARYFMAVSLAGKDELKEAGKLYKGINKKSKELRRSLALKLASAFSARAAKLYKDEQKAERKKAVDAAETYHVAAVHAAPEDAEALKEFVRFCVDNKREDSLIKGANGKTVLASVKKILSEETLREKVPELDLFRDIIKAALRGKTITKENIDVLTVIFERMKEVVSPDNFSDLDMVEFMRGLLPEIRDVAVQPDPEFRSAFKEMTAAIAAVRGTFARDAIYRQNTDIDMVCGLVSANINIIAAGRKNAEDILARLHPIRGPDKAEWYFAQFRLALTGNDIDRAEFTVENIARFDPNLTVPASRMIAEYYSADGFLSGLSNAKKMRYLGKAVSYWGDSEEAHRKLAAVYEGLGKDEAARYEEDFADEIKKYNKKYKTVKEPAAFAKGTWEEFKRHVVRAPFAEQAKYFWIPVAGALTFALVSGVLSLTPGGSFLSDSMIRAGFVIAHALFVPGFIRRHIDKRGTAGLVSALNVGMNLVLIFLEMSPLYHVLAYLFLAVTVHAAVNFMVFGVNRIMKTKLFGYATIEDMVSPKPSGEVPGAAPVIVIIDSGELSEEGLKNKYPAIGKYPALRFIAAKDAETFRAEASPTEQYVLIEMLEEDEIDGAIKTAAGIAEVQQLANTYPELVAMANMYPYSVNPYLSGMKREAMKELEGKSNDEVLAILRQAIPDEARYDVLESIISSYYSGAISAARPSLPETGPAAGPADVEAWLDEYNRSVGDSVDAYIGAAEGERTVDTFLGFYKRLIDHLKDRPGTSFASVILDHRKMAAQREDKNIEQIGNDVMARMPSGPHAIVIDSRLPGINIGTMIPQIRVFADKTKKMYVCIIQDPSRPVPPEVAEIGNVLILAPSEILDPEGREDIVGAIKKQKDLDMIAAFSVSVVTIETESKDVIDYSQRVGEKETPSYVVLGETVLTEDDAGERINRLLPSMAASSLLKRYIDEKRTPRLIAVQCSDSTIDILMDVFSALERITKLKISEMISDFIRKIKDLDISL